MLAGKTLVEFWDVAGFEKGLFINYSVINELYMQESNNRVTEE